MMALLALMLIPQAMWAQGQMPHHVTYYNLWIGSVQLTSDNADDVFGDGTVSYVNSTATLTLDNAHLSGAVSTTMANLNIHIKGTGWITSSDNCIRSTANTGTLKFTKGSSGDELVLRCTSDDKASVIKGFAYLDGIPLETQEPYEILDKDGYPRTKQSLRPDTTATGYAKVSADVVYPLWLTSQQVTSKNASNIAGYGSFESSTNTLTLTGLLSDVTGSPGKPYYGVTTGITNLTVVLVEGGNIIKCQEIDDYAFKGYGNASTISFIPDATNPGSLTMKVANSDGAHWFNGVTPSYSGTLALHDNGYDGTTFYVSRIAPVINYDLWVNGTQVTSLNAKTVASGVSYDEAANELTMNATYTVAVKTGLADLNVKLLGNNQFYSTSKSVFEGVNGTEKLNFLTDPATPGWYNIMAANDIFNNISTTNVTYQDDLRYWRANETNISYNKALIRQHLWEGQGTSNAPYHISSTNDLTTLATYVNNGYIIDDYFDLIVSDLDCSGLTTFPSIGKRVGNYTIYSFDGTFDGGGNKISNLTSPYGLFAHVGGNGTIKDLTLENCTATGGTSSGGKTNGAVPSESAGGVVAEFRSSGKIENCHVVGGSVSGGSNDEVYFVGGVVGTLVSGTIDLCTVENVDISELNASRTVRQSVGGVVGLGTGGTINGCSVTVNKNTSTAKISNQTNGSNDLNTGAILGEKESTAVTVTLTNNTYNADVEVVSQYAATTVTKSGNDQRGIGGGENDVVDYGNNTHGVELAGVNIITLAASTNGSIEAKSGYYKVEGTKVYAVPYAQSQEATVIRATSDNGYDSPSISVIKVGTSDKVNLTGSVTGVDATTNKNYSDNSFEMPNYNVTATGSFPIDFSNANRTFTISNPVGPVVYDGTAIAISEIKTTLNSTELTLSSTDFTITGYKNKTSGSTFTSAPKDAGQYEATIQPSATSVNKGTATVDFTISQRSITNVTAGINDTYSYTGSAVTPTVTVSDGNISITSNDYDISYQKDVNGTLTNVTEMKDAGAYKIVLTGKGNYKDTKSIDFTIGQKSISNVTASVSGTYSYTGSAVTPTLTVSDGNASITTNDYDISYQKNNKGTLTDVTEMKDAGAYKIVLTGKGNYKDTKSIDFSIGKAAATMTPPTAKTLTYNGTDQELVTAGSSSDGQIQYKLSTEAAWSTSIPKRTDKGTYTVDYQLIGDENHNDIASASIPVTISPKTITKNNTTITLSSSSFVYNTAVQQPSVQSVAVDGKNLTTGDYSVSYNGGTNVGSYTVTVTGTGNYDGSAIAGFNITAAPITPVIQVSDWVYGAYNATTNGPKVTDASNPGGGAVTFKYKKQGDPDANYGTSLPTLVGDYTVQATVAAKGNYQGGTATANFSITKAASTVTPPSAKTLTYTGSAQELVTAGSAKGGTIEYSLDGTTYSTTIPKGTDAKTYTVYYRVTGDGNHNNVAVATVDVTIAKAAATVTPPTAKTLTYTGSAQDLVTAGSAKGGTIEYSLDGTTYSTTIPKGTDAKTYTVYYRVTGDANHNNVAAATVDVTIGKAAATVTPPTANTLTYTGSAQNLITVGSATGGTIEYSLDGTTYSTTIPKGTDAKTYTVYYRVTGDANHNNVVAATVDVTIDQATITSVEIDQTQFVYDPTQERAVNVTKVMAGTLVVPVGSYEIVGNSNKATAIGTHTVTVQGKAGSNFKGTASTTFTITERMVYIDFGGRTFRTFYDANEPFLVPDDVTAYIITGVSGNTVTTKKVSYIQAGVPVLLESTPGTTNVADPAESFDGNLLKYAAPSGTAGDKHYILYNDEFVRATGLINGKVFLDLSDYGARARAYVINTDETTAVDGLFIEEDDGDAKWYDMQGRRINKPTKSGVYIKDGKKVVVKTRY